MGFVANSPDWAAADEQYVPESFEAWKLEVDRRLWIRSHSVQREQEHSGRAA